MGDAGPEGASALGPDADEERAVEPAAVLVVALDVDVGRPGQVGLALEDVLARRRTRTRRRGCCFPFRNRCRRRTGSAAPGGRSEAGLAQEPGVGALGGEDRRRHGGRPRRSASGLPQAWHLKAGMGHAPGALAGDAPVGPAGDHAGDPLLAPVGDPATRLIGLEGLGPEAGLVHGDEPLLGRPEDDRVLAAPAVRVGMGDLALLEERPVLLHVGGDAALASKTFSPA